MKWEYQKLYERNEVGKHTGASLRGIRWLVLVFPQVKHQGFEWAELCVVSEAF